MRVPRVPGRKFAPWILALETVMMMREHWGRLPVDDRRELARILRKSQGRYTNVNADERRELFRIVRQLDLITAGRKLMPMHGGVRKRHR